MLNKVLVLVLLGVTCVKAQCGQLMLLPSANNTNSTSNMDVVLYGKQNAYDMNNMKLLKMYEQIAQMNCMLMQQIKDNQNQLNKNTEAIDLLIKQVINDSNKKKQLITEVTPGKQKSESRQPFGNDMWYKIVGNLIVNGACFMFSNPVTIKLVTVPMVLRYVVKGALSDGWFGKGIRSVARFFSPLIEKVLTQEINKVCF